MQNNKEIKIGFWGGPEYSVLTLNKLHEAGFTIAFVATSLDKPKGRNLVLTPPPAKVWALAHDIPVLQPEKLKDPAFIESLKAFDCDVFVVMAYGKIMPDEILEMPRAKSLNIHPSLLPRFRGACPIESAILADERETGVTIMQMDHDMDHGPIVAQEKVTMTPWPQPAEILGTVLVNKGADLLVSLLPEWVAGKMTPVAQDHSLATYTKKIIKEDGLIDLSADGYANFLKIQAYHRWPSAYFFKTDIKNGEEKKTRVKITQASFIDNKLVIEKVIPEGRSEQPYTNFQ